MADSGPRRIYRITHFENLEGMLREGGIWCGNQVVKKGLDYKQIGLQDLTRRRAGKAVPIGLHGNLNDYVPFYFCHNSVMLYQIHTGQVPNYQEGQEGVIYLISTVEEIVQRELPFAFTDLHAKTKFAKFFDDVADLDQLDWEVIKSTDFKHRDDDPSRLERKQAEFLVYSFVPWDCIHGIAVYSPKWKRDCETLLRAASVDQKVRVMTGWYFR